MTCAWEAEIKLTNHEGLNNYDPLGMQISSIHPLEVMGIHGQNVHSL